MAFVLAAFHSSYRPTYGADRHPEDRRALRLAPTLGEHPGQPGYRVAPKPCRPAAPLAPLSEAQPSSGLGSGDPTQTGHLRDGYSFFNHASKPSDIWVPRTALVQRCAIHMRGQRPPGLEPVILPRVAPH